MVEPIKKETLEVVQTGIDGLVEIRPRVFEDDRGWFTESFNHERYAELLGLVHPFVQDNLSMSAKHTLRGLHFQSSPFAQSKLVSVLAGSVLDVVVDLRKESPTYGQHFKLLLEAHLKNQLYVPRGFAHGFLALEPETIFTYKCDNYYSPSHEECVHWNDPTLNIDWGIDQPIVSEKDKIGQLFTEYQSPF